MTEDELLKASFDFEIWQIINHIKEEERALIRKRLENHRAVFLKEQEAMIKEYLAQRERLKNPPPRF